MKKIILVFGILFLTSSSILAYNLSTQDTKNGDKITKKIEILINKENEKNQYVFKDEIVKKLNKLKEKYSKNEKNLSLIEYIKNKINKDDNSNSGIALKDSISKSNYSLTISGVTYGENSSLAQINANKNNRNQQISDFIGSDGVLLFKNSIYTKNLFNLIASSFSSSYTMIDSQNAEKSIFNYSQPKYYDSRIYLSGIDSSKQLPLSLFGIKVYIGSKFEFEKAVESYRTSAGATSWGKFVTTTRPLTYLEIIYIINSTNGGSVDSIYFSFLQAFYQSLPDYSILY